MKQACDVIVAGLPALGAGDVPRTGSHDDQLRLLDHDAIAVALDRQQVVRLPNAL